jgi:rubrerythrin
LEDESNEVKPEKRRWIWQCQRCGNAVVAESAPEECPRCGASWKEFTILEED